MDHQVWHVSFSGFSRKAYGQKAASTWSHYVDHGVMCKNLNLSVLYTSVSQKGF